jgi:hypothetical protein
MARLRKPHPGEILKEEFLNTIGMNQNQLAHTIGVPGNRRQWDPRYYGRYQLAPMQVFRSIKAIFCGFQNAYVSWKPTAALQAAGQNQALQAE